MKPSPSAVHETVADDPVVRDLRGRHAELRRARQAAVDARDRLQPNGTHAASVTLERLAAQGRVDALDDQLAPLERDLELATQAAATRNVAARRPKRLELLELLLDVAGKLEIAGVAVQEYDTETARLVGCAPGPHPLPAALTLDDAIRRIRRELEPPAEGVAAPVPAGKVRVKVVQPFLDRDRIKHWPVDGGGVEDLDERDAREAIEHGWAVPVE
jgi:hypothetical protein